MTRGCVLNVFVRDTSLEDWFTRKEMLATMSLPGCQAWLSRFGRFSATILLGMALTTSASATTRAEMIVRGRYLVEGIGACSYCHTQQRLQDDRQIELQGMHLAGGYGFNSPFLGRWAGANITPDRQTGIGHWTEAQIATAIREGLRPDRSVIGPPMPFAQYRSISDSDAAAIAAYLKTVPPIRNVVPPPAYRNPLPKSWGPPVSGVAPPSATDPVRRGEYLAQIGHCMDCHTPKIANGTGPDSSRVGVGGRVVIGLAGQVPSANITSDRQRGIGTWTDEQIIRAITQGIAADGRRLLPPMPYSNYAQMTTRDLTDLVAYLRSLPAAD
jgi:mono/diheme cytochrome c family protein